MLLKNNLLGELTFYHLCRKLLSGFEIKIKVGQTTWQYPLILSRVTHGDGICFELFRFKNEKLPPRTQHRFSNLKNNIGPYAIILKIMPYSRLARL